MKDLTHDQEIKLSELLFKALDMGCWHRVIKAGLRREKCSRCCRWLTWPHTNPNLFSRSAFLDVFDTVKDREDLEALLIDLWRETSYLDAHSWYPRSIALPLTAIATPDFQLAVLKWLLEKDGREDELKEILDEGN